MEEPPRPARPHLGVYTSRARLLHDGVSAFALAERLGFEAGWIANTGGRFDVVDGALAATRTMTIGTAVVNIWSVPPADAAITWPSNPRAVFGVGVGHGPLVERAGKHYDHPLARLTSYLNELDVADPPLAAARRMIGANGPRMMALAGDRALGALTYLVTPARTAEHRELIGPGATLAPELKIVLADDRYAFREGARRHLASYLTLPNYCRNLARMGFTADDLAAPGSDRLVEALFAGPALLDVVQRVGEHRSAGADHVALHVISAEPGTPQAAWRQLAEALLGR